jgi:Na+-translocating ferredoxin:NAD+ oxidoreductase RnfG subunit
MRPRFWHLFVPATALVAPGVAFAVDYMSGDQAQAALFPEADHFETRTFQLTDAQKSQLESKLGLRMRSKWVVRVAMRAGKVVGAVVVDDVIGKFDHITFAAGAGMDGVLREVEILSYRESHGQEVRQESWRKQFAGKTASSPLRVGDDIANISGATLSCSHVADGVRRIAAVLAVLQRSGALQ